MNRAGWAAQRTWAERKWARKRIQLLDIGVNSATQTRYYNAVRRLLPRIQHVLSDEELDSTVADWVQERFQQGAPLHSVADALSGLHFYDPLSKRKLVLSWKLYSIWRRYEVPMRAPPITEAIILGIAGQAFSSGELVLAGLLLLGFHAMLRTGEMLSVRPQDFSLGDSTGIVTLPRTKSGVRNNALESVSIDDPCVLEVCRLMVSELASSGFAHVPCWNASGSSFRYKFYALLSHFQLDHLGLKPYSIRRGGATHDFRAHGLMERTLIRGRWKSSSIARLYITDALSRIPQITMSVTSKKLLVEASTVFTVEQTMSGRRGKKRKQE